MYALSVDPGVECGWALWPTIDWHLCMKPTEWGVILPSKKLEWNERVNFMWETLKQNTFDARTMKEDAPDITDVYCEWPMFFGAESSATSGRGDLLKLMYTVGGIASMCKERNVRFHPIPVNTWKGQMPKEAVIERIRKRLPGAEFRTHAWDAVGIGLYAKGFF